LNRTIQLREKTLKNERKRVSTRLVAGLLAVLVAGAGLALTSGTASATQTVTQSTRISGVDKYATSASAAITSHGTNGTTASVLVSGESYADALSAAALAGAVSGPVILTDPDTLKGSTSLAIGQINSTTAAGHTIYIVGGTAAVGADVATSLTDLGYTVSRVSGADRVATADAVATKIRTLQDFGTNWDSDTTVFLTTARNFADAVAASGIAFQKVMPILLVEPGDALSAGTKAVLDSATNSIEHVIILGGTAAVSAAVETEVKTILNGSAGTTAIEVTRVGGADRYATAQELLNLRTKATTLNGFGQTATTVIMVNGTSHEDGMSATALAGANDSTMTLLTDGTGTLNATTSAALTAKASTITTIRAVGRTADLSAAEMTAADAAATTTTNTCTITANEGDSVVTITYSSAVLGTEGNQNSTDGVSAGTGAGLVTNYKRNNTAFTLTSQTTAGSPGAASGATIYADAPSLTEVVGSIAAATAASFTVGDVLATGDVISVPAATITDSGAVNTIAACSTTVANDATRPTVTVDSFHIGAAMGLLHFSEKVEDFAGTNSGDLDSSVTSEGGSGFHITQVTGTNYFKFERSDGKPFASGEILTVDASEFNDLGDLKMGSAAGTNATKTATTDTTRPTATAAIASTTVTQPSVTFTDDSDAQFKITAKAGGVAPGLVGELWTVDLVNTNGAAPSVSLYDTVNRKLVLGADLAGYTTANTPTPTAICTALNNHASAGSSFNCVVTLGGDSVMSADLSETALAGASELSLINVTWSETMHPDGYATVGNYDVNADGSTDVDSDEAVTEAARTVACSPTVASQTPSATGCATATGSNSHISGTLQFSYTATTFAQRLTAGTSTLHIAAGSEEDMAGNDAYSSTLVYKITIN